MSNEPSTPDPAPVATPGAGTEPGPPDDVTEPASTSAPSSQVEPAPATPSSDATLLAPPPVPSAGVADETVVAAAAAAPAPATGWPAAPPSVTSHAPPARGRGPLGALRSIAVGLVFFLACLSLVVATTAWWVDQTFLDTDAFVAVTAPLVEDAAVQETLAQATADRVAEAVDLGPLGSYVAVGIARELYASDAFAQLWEQAMRGVHTVVIGVLRDQSNVVDMVDDQVYINLYPFLDRILDRLGTLDLEIRGQAITLPVITDPSDPAASRAEVEAALGRTLPATFGVVPVARGENLVAAQQAFAVVETSTVVLTAITVLLAVLALVLARRRVRMIGLLGVGALASLLVARLVIAAMQDWVADAVTGGDNAVVIGNQIVDALATSYREVTQVAIVVALVAAVVATIVAWALDRQVGAERPGTNRSSLADGWFLAIAGLCVALAALIVVGLTLGSVVIVAIAYAAWLVIVVRTRRRGEPVAVAA